MFPCPDFYIRLICGSVIEWKPTGTGTWKSHRKQRAALLQQAMSQLLRIAVTTWSKQGLALAERAPTHSFTVTSMPLSHFFSQRWSSELHVFYGFPTSCRQTLPEKSTFDLIRRLSIGTTRCLGGRQRKSIQRLSPFMVTLLDHDFLIALKNVSE